jgi:pimeloyl-ACP methyl ester carboxylesterase
MEKVEFQVGGEKLVGQIIGGDPSILILHGAGTADKDRLRPIAEQLAENDIGSFSFDFSGHGESSGQLAESSLKKRVEQAEAALKYITKKPFSVVGSSMGGQIALELLKTHPDIQSLILFYPGIYTAEAFDAPFTDEFSKIIRQHESWRQNDVLGRLQTFPGNLLLVVADHDQVIPPAVFDIIEDSAKSAKSVERITVPNAEHVLLPTLTQNRLLYARVIDTIVKLTR